MVGSSSGRRTSYNEQALVEVLVTTMGRFTKAASEANKLVVATALLGLMLFTIAIFVIYLFKVMGEIVAMVITCLALTWLISFVVNYAFPKDD